MTVFTKNEGKQQEARGALAFVMSNIHIAVHFNVAYQVSNLAKKYVAQPDQNTLCQPTLFLIKGLYQRQICSISQWIPHPLLSIGQCL